MRPHSVSYSIPQAGASRISSIPSHEVTWYCKESSLAPKILLVRSAPTGEIAAVNITKILLLSSVIAVGTGLVRAQNTTTFEFTADSVANYRQGPDGTAFNGGTFEMNVRDGLILFGDCDAPFFFPPGGFCPIGSTGYISRGIENDPLLQGRGPYFEVVSVQPRILLKPYEPEAVRLHSAPPSLLPRPLGGFEDRSISVFFDLTTTLIRQADVTSYAFNRQYTSAERKRFDGEVVPGTYIYHFASITNPGVPVVIPINQFPKLDGYRKVNNVRQGVRFTDVEYDDGFAVLDPFVINTITWQGNTIDFIAPAVDNLFLSIKRLVDPTDPLSDPSEIDAPLFPGFTGAGATNVLLPSALDTSFILPPNFVDAGETGLLELEFIIFRPTSAVVYEDSIRRFRMPVKVLDPFLGFTAAALPPGATAEQMAAHFDFDGDGITNFEEWVFKSDPADKNSVPGSPKVNMVNVAPDELLPGPVTFDSIPETGSQSALEYKVAKLTNPVPKLKYAIEYSTDMNTWQEISANDSSWVLTETREQIKVMSSGTGSDVGGFFRTKVQPLD